MSGLDKPRHKYRIHFSRHFKSIEHANLTIAAEDVMEAIAKARDVYNGMDVDGTCGYLEWKEDGDQFDVVWADLDTIDENGIYHTLDLI